MAVAILKPKRGDTWRFPCIRTDENGDPVNLSDTTIAAELVYGTSRKSFDVEVTNATAGEFDLTLSAFDTAQLKTKPYKSDIEFTEFGVVESSETFLVDVIEDYTNAG